MEKKNRKQLKPILILIAAGILSMAGIYFCISTMKYSLWKHSVTEIMEVSSQAGHALEIYIEKDMQILKRIAKHLAQTDAQDVQAVTEIIDALADSDVSYTVTDLERGVMYAGKEAGTRRISEEERKTYETYTGRSAREPYTDAFTGQEVIGGYEMFLFADKTPGMVQVKRNASLVEDEFMLSFYNGCGFSCITSEQGNVLVRSFARDSGRSLQNINDVLEIPKNAKQNIQVFDDTRTKQKEGVMRLVFDGEDSILGFKPLKGTPGWYLLVIVPDAVIMKYADDILYTTQIFSVFMTVILAIVGLFLYLERQTDKKVMQKEDDLRYREQLFDILANNTDDVFLVFTCTDFEAEYVSPNVERILGIPQEEVTADIRVLEQTVDSRKRTRGYDNVKNLRGGGSTVLERERFHRKTGESKWFSETVYKTTVNDSQRYVAVLSDRTKERRAKQALLDALEIAKSANESKSVFLSNMSHDIRTPMNAIVGFSTLLQRDADNPEKVHEYTKKITASSQHLLGLINDVLDMSKIESGKTTLNISEISLADLVDELGAMMQIQAKAKDQTFKIDVYDIRNEQLLGDRLRINQILINILSNAVKYTPEGGHIEMTVRQMPQHTKKYARFHIEIADNGIGMSEEYLAAIFQPFSREETQKTASIQGTGLGMAITKNLVDLMGGTIAVESEPGKGSKFLLDLELRIQEQDADPDFWKNHSVTKLLVVDDDEEICLGIQKTMADTQVCVQYALSGQEAVELSKSAQAKGRGFDMILLDWQMPDISGIETARRIRRIVPANVPIMILTAYDISRIEKEGTAAGVDGFLQKPFFLSSFKMIVSSLRDQACVDKKAEVHKEENEDTPLTGLNILAAEDVEINAEILIELLKMAGASCEWAVNGQEVLTKFAQSDPDQYDLILMDVQMPVLNGYEATKAIRACAHPRAKTVPVIAMTANTFSEDVKEALDAGMNAHVGKPVDMEQLKDAVAKVLEAGWSRGD